MPSLPRAASSAGGGLLAAATGVLASLRPASKPLHPSGEVLTGRVVRRGAPERSGVGWLDEPGEDDADVRVSRAIGLPVALPDIHGLALRVHTPEGDGDVLFATTGRGRLTRFLLTPSRRPEGRPMTTLLPYRTATGPLVLAAEATGPRVYELSWARPAGDWHVFAELRLSARSPEQHVSFDPLLHQIAGLEQYPSVRRLREPAYRTARHSRGDRAEPTTATTNEENTDVQ